MIQGSTKTVFALYFLQKKQKRKQNFNICVV